MLGALVLSLFTVSSVHESTRLAGALILIAAADACLAIVAFRGSHEWRIAAIWSMFPTIYVVYDPLLAPHLPSEFSTPGAKFVIACGVSMAVTRWAKARLRRGPTH